MIGENYEVETLSDTLVITDYEVVRWYLSLETDYERQDQWVKEVTGKQSAVVQGHTLTHEALEIEYIYLTHV
jgi:hypothetical protein